MPSFLLIANYSDEKPTPTEEIRRFFLPAQADDIQQAPFSRDFLSAPVAFAFSSIRRENPLVPVGGSAAALLLCCPLFLSGQEQRLLGSGWFCISCLYPQAEVGMLTDCKTYSLLFLMEYPRSLQSNYIFPRRFLHPSFFRNGIKSCDTEEHVPPFPCHS